MSPAGPHTDSDSSCTPPSPGERQWDAANSRKVKSQLAWGLGPGPGKGHERQRGTNSSKWPGGGRKMAGRVTAEEGKGTRDPELPSSIHFPRSGAGGRHKQHTPPAPGSCHGEGKQNGLWVHTLGDPTNSLSFPREPSALAPSLSRACPRFGTGRWLLASLGFSPSDPRLWASLDPVKSGLGVGAHHRHGKRVLGSRELPQAGCEGVSVPVHVAGGGGYTLFLQCCTPALCPNLLGFLGTTRQRNWQRCEPSSAGDPDPGIGQSWGCPSSVPPNPRCSSCW